MSGEITLDELLGNNEPKEQKQETQPQSENKEKTKKYIDKLKMNDIIKT